MSLRIISLCAALALLAGCANTPEPRRSQFVNMDNERLRVEHREKPHKEIFSGLEYQFKDSVRLTLPEGKRVTCLQTVSTAPGVWYKSGNGKWLYMERGPYCILLKEGVRVFEGIYCREPSAK